MRVNIQCSDATHFVRASRSGLLDATATASGLWEAFEMETDAHGRFTLQTLANHPQGILFVRAIGGGGDALMADRAEAREHERFELVPLDGDYVAIRTMAGNYWRAKRGGGEELDTTATEQAAWEKFTIRTI